MDEGGIPKRVKAGPFAEVFTQRPPLLPGFSQVRPSSGVFHRKWLSFGIPDVSGLVLLAHGFVLFSLSDLACRLLCVNWFGFEFEGTLCIPFGLHQNNMLPDLEDGISIIRCCCFCSVLVTLPVPIQPLRLPTGYVMQGFSRQGLYLSFSD